MADDYVRSASHYVMLAKEANANVSRAIDELPNVALALESVHDNTKCVQDSVVQCEGIQAATEGRLASQRNTLSNAEVIVGEANETYSIAVHTCK